MSKNITEIDGSDLDRCINLKNLNVEKGNKKYHSKNNCIIETDSKTLVAGCKTSVIPSDGSVTRIGRDAFYWCVGLISIKIPACIEQIDGNAFFGASLLYVVNESYLDMSNYLDPDVYVGPNATRVFTKTDDGFVLRKETDGEVTLVKYVGNANEVVVPDGVTRIGNFAFRELYNVVSIELPDSVEYIEEEAFERCLGLTSLTIGENVKRIDYYALQQAFHLTEVYNKSSLNIEAGKGLGRGLKRVYNYVGGSKMTLTKDGFRLFEDGEEVILVNYVGGKKDVVIPENVTQIDEYAFYRQSQIKSVVIPDSVKSIGYRAFAGCTRLENVTFGENLTDIKDYAFRFCLRIKELNFNDKLTNIESEAFYGCRSLKKVSIPDSLEHLAGDALPFQKDENNANYGEISFNEHDDALYLGNETNPYVLLFKAKSQDITSCVINEKTKLLWSSAFKDCVNLTSVTIPDNVKYIGGSVFMGCPEITDITVPFLGYTEHADDDTDNWAELSHLFGLDKPSKLEEVTIKGGTKLDNEAFKGFYMLKKINLPDSIESIGDEAFSGCSMLDELIIPENTVEIGDKIFDGCDRLRYNTYGGGYYVGKQSNPYFVFVKTVTNRVTECNVHQDTKYIQSNACKECNDITDISIPDGIEYISNDAFDFSNSNINYNEYDNALYLGNADNPYVVLIKAKSTDITSCEVNTGTKIIFDNAFAECKNLNKVTIPNGVTYIGEYAFKNCEALTSMAIPKSVVTIARYAFYYCSRLESLVISNKTENMDYVSFVGCDKLATVYFYGTADEWFELMSYPDPGHYFIKETVYSYSSKKPTKKGNYWHKVNGVPTKWETV